MSIDNFWEDSGSKYKLRTDALTMRDVLRVYQLAPAPSKMENINDYEELDRSAAWTNTKPPVVLLGSTITPRSPQKRLS